MNLPLLAKAQKFDYSSYFAMAQRLVAENRTTGPNQSAAMLHYTKLNLKRMQRLNKTSAPGSEIIAKLNDMPFAMHWVVITEIWCGDAAQNIPYIAKLAEASPKVKLQLVLRDENTAYIDQFLTNGARSIPKLIMYNNEDEVLATWGPRPASMQIKVMDYINAQGDKPSFEAFSEEVHKWYTANRNSELELELLAILQHISSLETAP